MAIEVRMGSDKKPRYLVRIESVDPLTGNRKRIRAGQFTNRKAAERAEAEALIKRDRGTLLTADTTTMSALLDEWLAHKTGEISANSRTDYEGVVRNHLKPALGSLRVQLLTPQRIQAHTANGAPTDCRRMSFAAATCAYPQPSITPCG